MPAANRARDVRDLMMEGILTRGNREQ